MVRTKPAQPQREAYEYFIREKKKKKRTGRVMLTSWKAKSAFLAEENLLKAREGEHQARKEGGDFKRL